MLLIASPIKSDSGIQFAHLKQPQCIQLDV